MADERKCILLNKVIADELKVWAKINGISFSTVFVKLQSFYLKASDDKKRQVLLYALKLTPPNKACNIFFGAQGLIDYQAIKELSRNNAIINKLCAWFLSLSEDEKNVILYL